MKGPRGVFVAFEGADGAGKTTQIRLLADALTRRGLRVIITREPGGTPVGDVIRDIVLRPPHELTPTTELLLFGASRAQHVAGLIDPALAEGAWVLCDRFSGSTIAYQGYGLGVDLAMIRCVNELATGGLEPDVTVVLDLSSRAASARKDAQIENLPTGGGRDSIEARDPAFHERVRQGYLALGEHTRSKVIVIDARRSVEEVHEAVLAGLAELLEDGPQDA